MLKNNNMDECLECGAPMNEVGVIKNTRKLMCSECFVENIEYIAEKPCKHEFNIKKECAHCGARK